MLEHWGMRSTPSLPSLPFPLWPGLVGPTGPIYGLELNRGLSLLVGEVSHLNCVFMLN